jgi:hypothetical protein
MAKNRNRERKPQQTARGQQPARDVTPETPAKPVVEPTSGPISERQRGRRFGHN